MDSKNVRTHTHISIDTRDVHGNRISMGFPGEWEHEYAKNGNGNGKSRCDNGNGNMATLFMCAKIPMGRLDANTIQ